MKNVLWISACVPYDSVNHAGGKIHNYYLKYLKQNTDYHIKLITFFWKQEKEKIDLQDYQIDHILLERKIWSVPRLLINAESVLNPFNRYAGINQNYTLIQIKNTLRDLKKKNYCPKVIILQWTEMVVLWKVVKSFFPNVPIVGIEEDVKFLNFERACELEKNFFKRLTKQIRYQSLKRMELSACANLENIIVNNMKDFHLLETNGIQKEKLYYWQPYFENRLDREYVGGEHAILFYGAMNREENWKSVIWFLEHVFYRLEDQEVKFYVAGAHPNSKLYDYQNDRVKILGFVDDIGDYFSTCACMVAPLLLGAGIKIKVLEAMSSGIPVVTNSIGIEGIPASKGEHYLHCETPEEYVQVLDNLLEDKTMRKNLSEAEKGLIEEYFNLEKSAQAFADLLGDL